MAITVFEEEAVSSVVEYLRSKLPDILAQIEVERPGIKIPMFTRLDDEYMDPTDVIRLPYACVFVDESKDITEDRAMDQNHCSVRILSMCEGKSATKKCYRYNAAIRQAIQNDRTLGACKGLRAKVLSRDYYTPIMRGDQEVRVSETYIEITMEVQRR